MTEIVGGLNIRDVAEGGVVFEVKHGVPEEEESIMSPEYLELVQGFTNLECLDSENQYAGEEPFHVLANKMANLIEDGTVKKRVLKSGYGPKPEANSNVRMHYNAYVEHEAHPFDSTYARKKPYSCIMGDGQLIEGLEIAVSSMQLNEKSQFLIAPELAYRSGGLNRIPPNATILFEVELCDIMQPLADNKLDCNEKDFAHVYPFCLAQCVKGKRMFRLKNYQGVLKEYNTAVRKLEEVVLNNYDEQLKSDELMVRLYTNLLICSTHLQNYKKGCTFAQRIYTMSKNKTFKVSSKVYFNHAKCMRMLGDFQGAQRKLNQAKHLEPRNPEILQEFLAIRKAAEESKKGNQSEESKRGNQSVESEKTKQP